MTSKIPPDFVRQVKDHLYNLIVDEWKNSEWESTDTPAQGQLGRTGVDATILTESGRGNDVSNVAPLDRPTGNSTQAERAAATVDDGDVGFLDYVEPLHESVAGLGETFERLSGHTTRMTERIRAQTAESEALQQENERVKHIGGSRAQQEYVSRAKSVVDTAAEALGEYTAAMLPELELYRAHSRAMLANFRAALEEGGEFGNDEATTTNRAALVELIEKMETTRQLVTEFQTTIRRAPALTRRFKLARNRTTSMLGELVAEISFSIDEARPILDRLGSSDRGGAAS